jgi:redox-sensing transcriptional repressor
VKPGIPAATVGRLPVYLRALLSLEAGGARTVSSAELAAASGVNPAQVRKDLTHLRSSGTRGVGYAVDDLATEIGAELGLEQHWPVVIAGAGRLGQALANYGGFGERGFQVVAVVDADPAMVGEELAGIKVEPIGDLSAIVQERGAGIGVICTPAGAAQEVTDAMVRAGIRSILNFAPVPLAVPPGVEVRKVDLSVELQILTFHEQRRAVSGAAPV